MTTISKTYESLVRQTLPVSYVSTKQPISISYELTCEGIPKKWDFHCTDILQITKDTQCVEAITLLSPTYITTTSKINHLKGDTLIISNSPHIGNIQAKTVVLFESQADFIAADRLYLFHSYVKGDVVVKKHFESVVKAIQPGVESSVSFESRGAICNTKINDKGVNEILGS